MKVAIQGVKGSYHHQVADLLYGEVELLECSTFDQLALAVAQETVDKAIENSGGQTRVRDEVFGSDEIYKTFCSRRCN